MMIRLKLISTICLLSLILAQTGQSQDAGSKVYNYEHPIAYNPETYVCHFTEKPIYVDGQGDEAAWQSVDWSNLFIDIEGAHKPKPKYQTQVKMLWDSTYFYFYAKLKEPHVWATLLNRDDIIYYDDDFEIFIDPDGDTHNYYELEWNAFNTLWDLILLKPYRVDNKPKVLFEWNVTDVLSAVHIEGTINDPSDVDEYWSIEIALPWTALKELAPINQVPKHGDQWRVNFSRVDWQMEIKDSKYVKIKDDNGKTLPEQNWVWSPTGRINMHMPEMWGIVQFNSNEKKQSETKLNFKPDEDIRWALYNLYNQQLSYFKDHGSYTDQLKHFTIPQVASCSFKPIIYTTPHYFEIANASCANDGNWVINSEGKIELNKNKNKD